MDQDNRFLHDSSLLNFFAVMAGTESPGYDRGVLQTGYHISVDGLMTRAGVCQRNKRGCL